MTYKIVFNCKLNSRSGYIKMSLFKKVSDYIQAYEISRKYKATDLTYYSPGVSASMIR